jgi:hypothetical protein
VVGHWFNIDPAPTPKIEIIGIAESHRVISTDIDIKAARRITQQLEYNPIFALLTKGLILLNLLPG